MKQKISLSLISFLIFTTFLFAEDERRDGNWWVLQNTNYKLTYIVGFFDGMPLGHYFSFWNFFSNKKNQPCFNLVVKAYEEYWNKYFTEVTNYQINTGLDTFYSDFRNRRILVHDAIWLVVSDISGKSKEEMEKIIEAYRKNAVY